MSYCDCERIMTCWTWSKFSAGGLISCPPCESMQLHVCSLHQLSIDELVKMLERRVRHWPASRLSYKCRVRRLMLLGYEVFVGLQVSSPPKSTTQFSTEWCMPWHKYSWQTVWKRLHLPQFPFSCHCRKTSSFLQSFVNLDSHGIAHAIAGGLHMKRTSRIPANLVFAAWVSLAFVFRICWILDFRFYSSCVREWHDLEFCDWGDVSSREMANKERTTIFLCLEDEITF